MCLDVLTKRVDPTNEVIKGWKVFAVEQELLIFPFCYGSVGKKEEWMQAAISGVQCEGFNYDSGFHCFKTRKNARKFLQFISKNWASAIGRNLVIKKVLCREVKIEGEQDYLPVFVCNFIKV